MALEIPRSIQSHPFISHLTERKSCWFIPTTCPLPPAAKQDCAPSWQRGLPGQLFIMKMFTQSQLQAIADAFGDTSEGLVGSEIGHLLATFKMPDTSSQLAKRYRLYNSFAEIQNARQDRRAILAFIRKAMKPEIYARAPERYEPMRAKINRALAFAGLAVDSSGQLVSVERAHTLTEAQQRAVELRTDLEIRNIHPDVLRFCREELLSDNYFHAVLEVPLRPDDNSLGQGRPLTTCNGRVTGDFRMDSSCADESLRRCLRN
jgi:hypothetical protein